MSSSENRRMIFEYWFRTLKGSNISIDDILKIVLEFAKEVEIFDVDLCAELMKIEKNGALLYKTKERWGNCNAFGSIIASSGNLYHWKIKVIECNDCCINIGVVEAK